MHKPLHRNGDRALAKLIGNAVTAAQRAPMEPPAAPGPWSMPEAVTVGIQGRDGFKPMNGMVILNLSREYRRRFTGLGEDMFCGSVAAIRTIMLCRVKDDCPAPACSVAIEIIRPHGDFCVTVDGDSGGAYLDDPRALQRCLDDACARFADCLGV